MKFYVKSGLSCLRHMSSRTSRISFFSVCLGILLLLLPMPIQAEYTFKTQTDKDKAIQSYIERKMKGGPFLEREREEIPEPEVEKERPAEGAPEPLVEEKKEPSVIEKAYRIQYSDYILKQLAELEHIEIPSAWIESQRGTIEALDRFSVRIKDQLYADDSEIVDLPPELQASILK
ncbi:MAG: hypothetical protein JRI34_06940, partial [Deltaproteobacteria bacterium]|nr:hypothetical protein [Deltaproteobacteria bacterium]